MKTPDRRLHLVVPCALTAAALLAACAKAPDLSRASLPELGELVAKVGWDDAHPDHHLATDAFHELQRRPAAALGSEAVRLAGAPEAGRRYCAALLLGVCARDHMRRDGLAPEPWRQRLLDLVADPEPMVRGVAALGWAVSWGGRLPERAPEPVLAHLRAALRAHDAKERAHAAFTVLVMHRLAAPLAPDLLTALATEPRDGTQGTLAAALASTRVEDARIPAALLTLLDDPRDAVRAIAAGCLGDAAPPSAAATERLLALARDQAAAATVRQPALSSFARLVRSPPHAEAALELLLDEAAPYSEFQRVAWLVDVGRVLVLAPRSDAGRRALALLRDRSAPPPDGDVVEGDEALVAASVLARVAAVERTAAPDPALVARLHAGVATFLPDHGDPDAFDGHAAALQPMLEALVDLATWPGSGVAVADVRAALTKAAAHGDDWLREWAAEQLRRLP